MIKKFKCKLCKESKWTDRKGLRKHIGEIHARDSFTNSGIKDGLYIKQNWWIEEEFE